MVREKNRGIAKVYSLLSTYENTFVLFYDNEKDHLWISRPLARDHLLFAMYFVLIIHLYQQGYSEIFPNGLSALVRDLLDKYPGKSDTFKSSVNENDSIYYAKSWKKGPREMIATGRTCYVFKVTNTLAFKMVNLFRNEKESLEELENEYEVMKHINNEYSKLSIVPIVHYYGHISVYRTLVTNFIDGLRFEGFREMNRLMREACNRSVRELHSCKVLHGDLEPWNFIIVSLKAQSLAYKAYIVDFGRAKLNADEKLLSDEYDEFCLEARIDGMNNRLKI